MCSLFTKLQEEVTVARKANKKEMLLEKLPEKFNTNESIDLAKELSIAIRTADKHITDFCEKGLIEETHYNEYLKRQD